MKKKIKKVVKKAAKSKTTKKKIAVATGKKKAVKKVVKKKVKATKPTIKKSPSLLLEKKDLVRQTIVSVLWSNEELTPSKLKTETEKLVSHQLGEQFGLYYKHVIDNLTSHKMVEEVLRGKTVNLRLIQKIE